MISLIYKNMCPNCGGDITSERLAKGLVCQKCLPEEVEPSKQCEVVRGEFEKVCRLWEEVREFEEFFGQKIGFGPRELQLSWAKRFFLGRSFALLAPTGIGKTTFGLSLASFIRPKKSYLLFPTALLAKEAAKRLQSMGQEPLLYESSLSKRAKEEIKAKIEAGDFEILITTTSFLYRNFEIIPRNFDLIFVDDVDSILKSAKNIDKVLMVAGFEEADIQKALEFIDYKRRIAKRGRFDPKEYEKRRKQIEKIATKPHATVIVSSATANPRSRRVHLFRELLGFEVSRPKITIRNIEDIYEEPQELDGTSVERIKELGKGGLVFLPGNETKERLKEYVQYLRSSGIEAIDYEELKEREEDFRSAKVQVVVGFASYRNPLARGIDMPDTIRYALFVGVPKMEFGLDISKHISLYYFLLAFLPALEGEELAKVREWIEYLSKVAFIPKERLQQKAKERISAIYEELQSMLTPQFIQKLNENPHISIKKEDTFKIVTADVTGYIQASGRTSRLYVGGLTKGLAYLLVDDPKAFHSLQKKVRWFSDEIEFKRVDEVDLQSILAQIDEDRQKLRLALEGRLEGSEDLFKTTLVIVESPNKARTIANFYGRPIMRELGGVRVYEVAKEGRILSIAASKGHLYDLNKEEGFHGVLAKEEFVEIFEPIDESKAQIAQAIRELDLEIGQIFLASDPDVEGEKISYDLWLNSLPFNPSIKRAEFHEVTRRAFDQALEHPRDVDENLVKAQLVRRVADRWIGFEISQYLQKRFGRKSLSAGRVQTAVLEWIVLREYEAKQKVWVVRAEFGGEEVEFVFEQEKEAREFFDTLKKVRVQIQNKEPKKLFRTPYSTDKMLQAAAEVLHYSPQRTMQLAQELFESGLITYHRTDSIRVSPAGIAVAKEYITDRFGEDFFRPRSFSESVGAHECIRPTRPMDATQLQEYLRFSNQNLTPAHIALYDLIFRNFIASQMREAVVEEAEASVVALALSASPLFSYKIVEHGIDLVVEVPIKSIQAGEYEVQKELHTRPKKPHYTYAQIIGMMKERGIGRPSTYAITIQKLLERHYVIQRGTHLIATKLGIEVYEEIKRQPSMYAFVNERYTRELEELMDRVERGEVGFQEVLHQLYEKIQKEIHENIV